LFRMPELKCTKKCMISWAPKRLERIYIKFLEIRERKTRDLCTVWCVKNED